MRASICTGPTSGRHANVGIALGPSRRARSRYRCQARRFARRRDRRAPSSPRPSWSSVDTGIAPEPSDKFPELARRRARRAPLLPRRSRFRHQDQDPRRRDRSVGLYARQLPPGCHHPSGAPYEGKLPHARRLPQAAGERARASRARSRERRDRRARRARRRRGADRAGRPAKTPPGWAMENLYASAGRRRTPR